MFEVCWDIVDSGSELGWMSEFWFYKFWEWWLYMGGQWIEDCELCRIEEFEYWKWLICWIEWILGEVICVVMNEYCFGYGDKAVLRGMNDERDGL